MSVRPLSVRMEQLVSHWTGFYESLFLSIFWKSVKEMQLYIKTCAHVADFFLEWEMFQTKVVEEIKTYIFPSVAFFREPWRLWDVEKYCIAGLVTDDNTAHAHCMLDI